MAINIEQIGFRECEFFRVLRWNRNVDDAEILGGTAARTPLRGKGSVWHLHEEMELAFVAEGCGTRFVGDQVMRFAAPSLVLLGPNLPHCWQFDGRSSGLCVQWSVPRMSTSLPPDERSELRRASDRAAKGLEFSGAAREQATAKLQELVACHGVSRMGVVLQLIGSLARARKPAAIELSTTRFDVSRLAPGYESIQTAILLILSRFREPLTLDEVRAAAQTSKATFSRRFVTYTGRTFTAFLNEVRIDFACRKLIETADSVSAIAFASGFNNLAHFNRMFRRLRTIAPTEYRAQRN